MDDHLSHENAPVTRLEIFKGLFEEANRDENPGSTRVSAWKELNAMLTAEEKKKSDREEVEYSAPNVWITIEKKSPRNENGDDDSEDSSLS